MALTREWLLDDTPSSRLQARLGRFYRIGRALLANPLAVVGAVIVLVLIGMALFAPWIATHSATGQNLSMRLMPPSAENWMGTDELGRDIWSRVVFGSRITLVIVLLVAVLAAPVGLIIGAVAGYFGGWLDKLLMGITDIFLSMPKLILALAFVAALGPGIQNAIIAIAIATWPGYARIARAETLTIRNSEFIAAVELQGASALRVIVRHILPLCTSSMIIRVTLDMAGIILTAAGLGFIGLGAQPPLPEWGAMISEGRRYMLDSWWTVAAPGAAILAVSMAFNLLGDGLNDALDPRQAS